MNCLFFEWIHTNTQHYRENIFNKKKERTKYGEKKNKYKCIFKDIELKITYFKRKSS